MRNSFRRVLTAGLAAACFHGTGALAQDPVPAGGWFPDFGYSLSGFVRPEFAYSANGRGDPFNQRGNLFNRKPTSRDSDIAGPGTHTLDTAVRNGIPDDSSIHVAYLRTQVDGQINFSSDWNFTAKVHALFDPGVYSNFNPQAVGMRSTGEPIDSVYGRPNYYKYQVDTAGAPNPFEWAGRNYLVYLPAFFLEYNHGPMDLRLGNQQIAWGQALFFRVLDVVDGLDLRRHSLLDFASEEFSDKRVPAVAARISYQLGGWLADAFVQKFQPTIYSNPNTPYNVIASQFTVHDLYGAKSNQLDEGIRFKGSVGPIGVQAIAVHRFNPDGVFRWTASNVNRDLPGLAGSGAALQHTAFEWDPTGVWSAKEWFTYAGMARLNGITGLNASINDFQPYTGALGAAPVSTYAAASQELDRFFQVANGAATGTFGSVPGGLRGHIARDYFAEDVLGGGLSYVFAGPPGSVTDQLILNVEATFVPNRTFTSPDLDVGFLRKHEWTADFVLEKYQRFSSSLPATYFVFQGMHKTESDIFGRYLGGMGGDVTHAATGYGGGWTALAFAFQQPFPRLIWRFDYAMLYDVRGGLLIQPAVRWKPNGHFTVEAFYNYLNGQLRTPNNNIVSTVDWADEIALRVGYQF